MEMSTLDPLTMSVTLDTVGRLLLTVPTALTIYTLTRPAFFRPVIVTTLVQSVSLFVVLLDNHTTTRIGKDPYI